MCYDSFEDKKHSKTTGRRGYENGSHSEIEVSKLQDWTAFEIYSRTEKLLVFMQERWNLQFDEEQLEKLIGISFVKDGREIPEELEEVSSNVPESEERTEDSSRSRTPEMTRNFNSGRLSRSTRKSTVDQLILLSKSLPIVHVMMCILVHTVTICSSLFLTASESRW